MPLSIDGKFLLTESVTRVELAIDFILGFSDVVRQYREYFSSAFFYRLVQKPMSKVMAERTLVLLRLESLIADSIPAVEVESTSVFRPITEDRKIVQFAMQYRINDSQDPVSSESQVYARFVKK